MLRDDVAAIFAGFTLLRRYAAMRHYISLPPLPIFSMPPPIRYAAADATMPQDTLRCRLRAASSFTPCDIFRIIDQRK